jgi:rare lipoprotein A
LLLRFFAACVASLMLLLSQAACADDSLDFLGFDTAEAVTAAEPGEAAVEKPADPATTLVGLLSFYGKELAGQRTSSGERFDPKRLTMAHPTLPFGTRVRVTNLRNNRSVVVRVNDRGPFTGGRVADVSLAAASLLGMVRAGIVRARLEVLGMAGALAPARR